MVWPPSTSRTCLAINKARSDYPLAKVKEVPAIPPAVLDKDVSYRVSKAPLVVILLALQGSGYCGVQVRRLKLPLSLLDAFDLQNSLVLQLLFEKITNQNLVTSHERPGEHSHCRPP